MVYEDIEDLKKFGKGIQHSSNPFSSKHRSHKRSDIQQISLKKIRDSIYNPLLMLGKDLLFSISQCKDIVLLRIPGYKDEGYYQAKSQTENIFTRKICRLREERRQIGDTTIIIRKRIYYDLPRIRDLSNDPEMANPSIYFFRKQNDTKESIGNRDKRYSSVFDIPSEHIKKTCSIKERLYLFFLRC
jgi:hypothetical protein